MRHYSLFLGIGLVILLILYTCVPDQEINPKAVIDKILVLKAERKLLVFEKGILLKPYPTALGRVTTGAKETEGDGKTPEGRFIIDAKSEHSSFYKNLSISYPDSIAREKARTMWKSPGGNIKIHGLRTGLG